MGKVNQKQLNNNYSSAIQIKTVNYRKIIAINELSDREIDCRYSLTAGLENKSSNN